MCFCHHEKRVDFSEYPSNHFSGCRLNRQLLCLHKKDAYHLRRPYFFAWTSKNTRSIVSCSTILRHLTSRLIYNDFVYATTQDFKVQCDHLYNLTGHCQPSDPKLSLYCLKIHTNYFHYFLLPFFCLWQICHTPPDISEFQSQLLWDQNSGQNVSNLLEYIICNRLLLWSENKSKSIFSDKKKHMTEKF